MDEILETHIRAAIAELGPEWVRVRAGESVTVDIGGTPVVVAVGSPPDVRGLLFDDVPEEERQPPGMWDTHWLVFLAVRSLLRENPARRLKRAAVQARLGERVSPSSTGKALRELRRLDFLRQIQGRVYVLGESAPGRHFPGLPGAA